MEQFITLSTYIKLTSIVLFACSIPAGYWILQVKENTKTLMEHKEEDEKEFQDMLKNNQAEHAQLRLEMTKGVGELNAVLAELKTEIKNLIAEIKRNRR